MTSANIGEPFKFLTISLKSLEEFVGPLKNSSPGHDDFSTSVLKDFFQLMGPVILRRCNKTLKDGIFPDILGKQKKNH